MISNPQLQQWFEKQLEVYLLRDQAKVIAGSLASAWPSSPQGTALVKQLVEALEWVDRWVAAHPWTGLADAREYNDGVGLLGSITAALAAAEKAGLT